MLAMPGWLEVTLWVVGLLVSLLLIGWWVFAAGNCIQEGAEEAVAAVKDSSWYKARQEKKEIERLQRQLIKRHLEDELSK